MVAFLIFPKTENFPFKIQYVNFKALTKWEGGRRKSFLSSIKTVFNVSWTSLYRMSVSAQFMYHGCLMSYERLLHMRLHVSGPATFRRHYGGLKTSNFYVSIANSNYYYTFIITSLTDIGQLIENYEKWQS